MRTILRWLRDDGHDVSSLCATPFEGLIDADFRAEAHRQGIVVGPGPVADFHWDGIPGRVVESRTPRGQVPDPEEVEAYVATGTDLIKSFRPDLLLVMGAHRALHEVMRRARAAGSKVVYSLRNYGYERRALFQHVDAVLTCSKFLSGYYEHQIGLRSTAIPSPVEWDEVQVAADHRKPTYLTFVNPAPRKGVALAARLFEALEIPTQVFASEVGADSLRRFLDPIPEHVQIRSTTDDPREIYREARVLLAPSLAEPFGRVAVEAMINAVPVLAADRGGLPEALAGSGVLVQLPESLIRDPQARLASADASDWLRALRRLWETPGDSAIRAREIAEEVYAESVQRSRTVGFFEALLKG